MKVLETNVSLIKEEKERVIIRQQVQYIGIQCRSEAGLQEKPGKEKESHQSQHRALCLDFSSLSLGCCLSLSITWQNRPPETWLTHFYVIVCVLVGGCFIGQIWNLRGEKLSSLNQYPSSAQLTMGRGKGHVK